jgi:hypothetical protein
MTTRINKIIAREWLLFLGVCVLGGGVILPVLILTLANGKTGDFYKALFDPSNTDFVAALLFVISPYLLMQVGRSIWWAYRTVRPRREKVVEQPVTMGQESTVWLWAGGICIAVFLALNTIVYQPDWGALALFGLAVGVVTEAARLRRHKCNWDMKRAGREQKLMIWGLLAFQGGGFLLSVAAGHSVIGTTGMLQCVFIYRLALAVHRKSDLRIAEAQGGEYIEQETTTVPEVPLTIADRLTATVQEHYESRK